MYRVQILYPPYRLFTIGVECRSLSIDSLVWGVERNYSSVLIPYYGALRVLQGIDALFAGVECTPEYWLFTMGC